MYHAMQYHVACHVHPLPGDVMLTLLKSRRSPCTWYCHRSAQRDAKSLYLQICGHRSCQIWIRWTRASGASFKRGSTVRRSMMWRSWKNVCWASGGCWTTTSSRQRLHSGVVVWMHVWKHCVRVNGGHFEQKFWASDYLRCFVCFIDTGCPKCDRYKHVQSTNIMWNVLLLCLRLSHGMVAT